LADRLAACVMYRTRDGNSTVRAQRYTTSQLLFSYTIGTLCLVHFDSIRLRALRIAFVQVTLGLVLLANNIRVLLRERTAGACTWPRRPRAVLTFR
jgi:hypothetical protein